MSNRTWIQMWEPEPDERALAPDAKIVDAASAALVALAHLDQFPSHGSHTWFTCFGPDHE